MPTYTYDLSNDIGKLREWLQDNDLDNAVWADEQIIFYYQTINSALTGYTATATLNETLLAASTALEMNANKLAYLATKQKIAIFQEDTEVTYKSVLAQAKRLKDLAGMQLPPSVTTPDNFYTLNNSNTNPFTVDPSTAPPSTNLGTW